MFPLQAERVNASYHDTQHPQKKSSEMLLLSYKIDYCNAFEQYNWYWYCNNIIGMTSLLLEKKWYRSEIAEK